MMGQKRRTGAHDFDFDSRCIFFRDLEARCTFPSWESQAWGPPAQRLTFTPWDSARPAEKSRLTRGRQRCRRSTWPRMGAMNLLMPRRIPLPSCGPQAIRPGHGRDSERSFAGRRCRADHGALVFIRGLRPCPPRRPSRRRDSSPPVRRHHRCPVAPAMGTLGLSVAIALHDRDLKRHIRGDAIIRTT